MARGLTKNQREFVKTYVKTDKNGTQTALQTYNATTPNSAAVEASRTLKKAKIVEAIEKEEKRIADRIPDDLVVEKHIALLNKVDNEGQIDVNAVSSGIDKAYKLKGSYAPEKTANVNVEIETTSEALDIARKFEQELKEKL